MDGLGELAGAPGAAAQPAGDSPGPELAFAPSAGKRGFACALLACFWDCGLFFPWYGSFAYALPGVPWPPRVTRTAASSPPARPGSARPSCRALSRAAPEDPPDAAAGAGDDLQVHAVLLVLAGVERPVRGHPADGDQRPVHDHAGVPGLLRGPDRRAQLRRPGREQRDGLGRVPPGRRCTGPEPGREPADGGWADTAWCSPPGSPRRPSRATSPAASTGASARRRSAGSPCTAPRGSCGSLLAALDVHPRVAMQILRHGKVAITMEIYTEVVSSAAREALRRLGDQLGP